MTKISRRSLFLCWVSECILWLVFVDTVDFRELIVGAGVAALATYFSAAFASRKKIASFRVPRGIGAIRYVPGVLARDTAVLMMALIRRITGKPIPSGFVAIPFAATGNDPSARGKRAFATTLMAITPNTLVLGVLKDQKILFFHRLLPQPPSQLARHLSSRTGSPA